MGEALCVDVGTQATMDFSEPINPLTVTPATFYVDRTNGVVVPGTVSVAPDGLSATFTPDAPLDPATSYRIRAFSTIKDFAGFGLTGSTVKATFTTN